MFVLTEQADRLLRVRSDFLDPSRNHPERWIGVPAVADELDISRIEFQSLGFLFEQTGSKLEGAVLLQELFASQRQTESAIETLRKRSDFHLQEIQPALDTLPEEVLRERFIPVDKIGAALGERRVGMLKSFTEAVYQSFDWAVSANEQAFGRLRAFLVHRYPKSRFIERVLKVPTQPDTSSPFRPL